MKITAIVQARMTSTRLPGKVLKQVCGHSLLALQIERLRRAKLLDQIIVATTVNETDRPIVELCQQIGVPYYRGSEHDVLARYYDAATVFQADPIVRITADCPLIDPQIVDGVIQFFLDQQAKYDYVSNTLERHLPRGMDTEVFTFRALAEAYKKATIPYQREHVTPFIYENFRLFRLGSFKYTQLDLSKHRWTVDTAEDFQLIKMIIEALYPVNPEFNLQDILKLLAEHPDWMEINAKVKQKKLEGLNTRDIDEKSNFKKFSRFNGKGT